MAISKFFVTMVVLLCAAAMIAGCGSSSVSPGNGSEAPLLPPTNVIAKRSSDGNIVVFWDMSTQANLKGYNVYRAESRQGSFTKLNPVEIDNNHYIDTTCEINHRYTYRVTAVSTKDSETGYSAVQITNSDSFTKDGRRRPDDPKF